MRKSPPPPKVNEGIVGCTDEYLHCVQPSEDLWKQLHQMLHIRDKLRFPLPLDSYSNQSFSALFSHELPSVHLILDEAYALRSMPEQAIASFLETVLTLRDYRSDPSRRGSLASMTLLGVEGLASILSHRSWESSNEKSPFTMVSLPIKTVQSQLRLYH